MTIRLPKVLASGDDDAAVDVLLEYFRRPWVKTGRLRSGGAVDEWDPSGTRQRDADVFTADDLVAVTLLSVRCPPTGPTSAAERRDEFAELLRAVGPDRRPGRRGRRTDPRLARPGEWKTALVDDSETSRTHRRVK
ncbi:hypothetical protein GTA09_17510 [Rhodococcus hoagii]|nr:hypothetical protein [Prescottella equi]